MAFNKGAAADQLRDIAAAFGVNIYALSQEEAAQAAVDQVTQLCKDIGIPSRLREADVTAEMIPDLARQAIADQCHLTNPRPCTEEDMINLYRPGTLIVAHSAFQKRNRNMRLYLSLLFISLTLPKCRWRIRSHCPVYYQSNH